MIDHPLHSRDTIELIAEAWGWRGLSPAMVIQTNSFGSTLVEDLEGRIWKITPDLAKCELVADSHDGLRQLQADDQFALDWSMGELRPLAIATVGRLMEGECYAFKIPPILGGGYGADNLCKMSVQEVLLFSGSIARQTNDLPDGARVRLTVVD